MSATIATVAGDPDAARRYLDEAQSMAQGLDDFAATIELLLSQSIHAIFMEDLETAEALSLEGVALSREAGDLYQLENMFRNLGVAANDVRRSSCVQRVVRRGIAGRSSGR